MKTTKNNPRYYLLLLFALALAVMACNKDDSNDDDSGGGGNFGEATFTVAGAINGSFTGNALFLQDDEYNYWMLDLYSATGDGQGNVVWELEFGTHTEITNYRPETGTYPVRYGNEPEIFLASFEYFENGFDPEGGVMHATYLSTTICPLPEHGGILTITASSADEISGSFEITLLDTDYGASCEPLGEVIINGTFRAVNVE